MHPRSPVQPTLLVLGLAVTMALITGGPGTPPPGAFDQSSVQADSAAPGIALGPAGLVAPTVGFGARPGAERAEASAAVPASGAAMRLEAAAGAAAESAQGIAPAAVTPRVVTHVVRAGETLSSIAQQYRIDVSTIQAANRLRDVDTIRIGEQLSILTVDGVLHRVQAGESLWDIARRFGVEMDKIIEANNLSDPERLQVQQPLVIPGGRVRLPDEDALVGADGRLRRAFGWPVRGPISSTFGMRWGRMHEGVDIAISQGTPIRAAADGEVTFSGWGGGYGYLVIVDHGRGIETRYGHNSRVLVNVGDHVMRGQVVARSGNTGHSTGPHLHFEVRRYKQSLDPLRYLR